MHDLAVCTLRKLVDGGCGPGLQARPSEWLVITSAVYTTLNGRRRAGPIARRSHCFCVSAVTNSPSTAFVYRDTGLRLMLGFSPVALSDSG